MSKRKTTLYPKVCVQCGEPFLVQTNHKHQKNCSPACGRLSAHPKQVRRSGNQFTLGEEFARWMMAPDGMYERIKLEARGRVLR